MSRSRTKRARKSCGAMGCSRPHYAKGFCRAHYREAARASKRPGNVDMGHATGTPKSTPSDLGLWLSFSGGATGSGNRDRRRDPKGPRLPRRTALRLHPERDFSGGRRQGETYSGVQVPGVVCADCHHHWTAKCGPACEPICIRKQPVGWCDSPNHPIFFGKWETTWPTPKKSKPKVVKREYLDHLRYCDGKCEVWSAGETCSRCGGPTRKT
jgi:hypothetical protein